MHSGIDAFAVVRSLKEISDYRLQIATSSGTMVTTFQKALDSGIQRCAFAALSPNGAPIAAFDRSNSDISGRPIVAPITSSLGKF